jgi:hypothetical protein
VIFTDFIDISLIVNFYILYIFNLI